ncbi:hypothetical protein WJX72_002767 [[Myrmecia] bisecta]|uniref:Uncharacterized protein n=1 Tax=[Myrmecia] bisecta TaxID=41462 RepID=A0AAW1Q335_9CHLO
MHARAPGPTALTWGSCALQQAALCFRVKTIAWWSVWGRSCLAWPQPSSQLSSHRPTYRLRHGTLLLACSFTHRKHSRLRRSAQRCSGSLERLEQLDEEYLEYQDAEGITLIDIAIEHRGVKVAVEARGWHVVTIPWFEWGDLEAHDGRTYLVDKLRAAFLTCEIEMVKALQLALVPTRLMF